MLSDTVKVLSVTSDAHPGGDKRKSYCIMSLKRMDSSALYSMCSCSLKYRLIVTIAIAVKCWNSSGVKGRKVNSSSSQKRGTMDSGSGVIRSENEVEVQPSIQWS